MSKQAEEVASKIYVQVRDGKTITLNRVFDDDVCYIRKDALLEWAECELSKRRDTGDDYFIPAIVILNDLIDKLNSM